MNTPQDRKRLAWLGAIAAVVVLSVAFVYLMAPSSRPAGEGNQPVLRPHPESTSPGAEGSVPLALSDDATQPAGFSMSGGEALSLAWRLGLVVVIIAVSIAALRWWGKRAAAPRSVTGFIRVIDTLAISNGRTIHLVALGDRVIAVGATQQQLTFLNELTPEEAAKVLAEVPRLPQQPIASFAAELFQSMRSGNSSDRLRESVVGEEAR